ncbi:MAG: polysaccharide biosynthesis/export family protein [Bacteroidales bacterium]
MKHFLSHPVLFILISLLFFSSCLPLPYVQSDRVTDREFVGQQLDNIISPGDELYIRITSADDEQAVVNFQDQGGRIDPTLLSHTVSDDGTIKLPYINRIQLAGLTLEQASDEIETALSQYMFIPSAYVRFINTKVTVLGEVRNPGVYVFNYKNINILQAIGYAQDITDFGNRRKVLVIREEGITRTKTYVDLTTDDLLESEHYLIKSDDIIFVEPLGRKIFGIATVPYNLIFSLITTGIFVYSFITN